jgi:[acyl-carrier-protein] S-malonyltransferase
MPLIDFGVLTPSAEAWVFPGQGAQQVGMSVDFADSAPEARALFDEADELLGRLLSHLIAEGPEEELVRTVNTQPAVFVASLAALVAARAAGALRRPLFVAGHSLGEYTAVVAAGSLPFADGLRLVAERARLMQEAGEENPGTLAALLGADIQQAAALAEASGCQICNLNAPGQVVIGGTLAAVDSAVAKARDFGIKRATALKVGGAFHTSLMAPAAERLRSFVEGLQFADPVVPLVANGSAAALRTGDEVRDELVFQLNHPVRWEDSVKTMIRGGATLFTEFGPGNVLTGLIKRIDPEVQTANVATLADLPSAVQA